MVINFMVCSVVSQAGPTSGKQKKKEGSGELDIQAITQIMLLVG